MKFFTYVVLNSETHMIKVGRTNNPTHRFQVLRSGWPSRKPLRVLLVVTGDHEAQIRADLRTHLIAGEEVFEDNRAVRQYIRGLKRTHTDVTSDWPMTRVKGVHGRKTLYEKTSRAVMRLAGNPNKARLVIRQAIPDRTRRADFKQYLEREYPYTADAMREII